MPITDKVAAAKQIGEFLQAVISNGGFKLKYRITVDPPIAQDREWEHPEILSSLPDRFLLVARARGELLRSFELWRRKSCTSRAASTRRSVRLQEFPRHANRRVAAARGLPPNRFAGRANPTASTHVLPRGRIVHLALREEKICAPKATARAEDAPS